MKNTKGKKIQFECSAEIMELIERFQKVKRAKNGPPILTRAQIVANFLEHFKGRIKMLIENQEQKLKK
jgi:hypothetical protein